MSIEVRSSCNSISDLGIACSAYCFSCFVSFHLIIFISKSYNYGSWHGLPAATGRSEAGWFVYVQHVNTPEHRRYYNITFRLWVSVAKFRDRNKETDLQKQAKNRGNSVHRLREISRLGNLLTAVIPDYLLMWYFFKQFVLAVRYKWLEKTWIFKSIGLKSSQVSSLWRSSQVKSQVVSNQVQVSPSQFLISSSKS